MWREHGEIALGVCTEGEGGDGVSFAAYHVDLLACADVSCWCGEMIDTGLSNLLCGGSEASGRHVVIPTIDTCPRLGMSRSGPRHSAFSLGGSRSDQKGGCCKRCWAHFFGEFTNQHQICRTIQQLMSSINHFRNMRPR